MISFFFVNIINLIIIITFRIPLRSSASHVCFSLPLGASGQAVLKRLPTLMTLSPLKVTTLFCAPPVLLLFFVSHRHPRIFSLLFRACSAWCSLLVVLLPRYYRCSMKGHTVRGLYVALRMISLGYVPLFTLYTALSPAFVHVRSCVPYFRAVCVYKLCC